MRIRLNSSCHILLCIILGSFPPYAARSMAFCDIHVQVTTFKVCIPLCNVPGHCRLWHMDDWWVHVMEFLPQKSSWHQIPRRSDMNIRINIRDLNRTTGLFNTGGHNSKSWWQITFREPLRRLQVLMLCNCAYLKMQQAISVLLKRNKHADGVFWFQQWVIKYLCDIGKNLAKYCTKCMNSFTNEVHNPKAGHFWRKTVSIIFTRASFKYTENAAPAISTSGPSMQRLRAINDLQDINFWADLLTQSIYWFLSEKKLWFGEINDEVLWNFFPENKLSRTCSCSLHAFAWSKFLYK